MSEPDIERNVMKVFVTGASGWVASAVIPELLAAGHTVTGLARSDASAAEVERRGARVVRGSLSDVDVIADAAREADGVVHLAFPHENMNDMAAAAATERAAIEAVIDALAGSGKPYIAASGTPTTPGRPSTEDDSLPAEGPAAARGINDLLLRRAADKGVRSAVVRLPRSVHGEGDRHGFIPQLVRMFTATGTAMYVGDGTNRWCAVHVADAARLFRLALENAPAGAALHAVGDEGIPVREIAEALGARLGLPAVSVEPSALGFYGLMQTVDHATTAAKTRALLGWEPTHPGLLDDVAAGHYDG